MKRKALALACIGFILGTLQLEAKAEVVYLGEGFSPAAEVLTLDMGLNPQSFFFLPANSGDITGIAAGPSGQIYVTTPSNLYEFSALGSLHHQAPAFNGQDVSVSNTISASVPEPSTLTLMAVGILGILALYWRRWKRLGHARLPA